MHGGHWLTPGVLGVWKIGCVCVCVCVCSLRDGQREREPWGYSTGGSVPCVRVAVCVCVCVCVCERCVWCFCRLRVWRASEQPAATLPVSPVRWLLLRLCSSPASPLHLPPLGSPPVSCAASLSLCWVLRCVDFSMRADCVFLVLWMIGVK